MNQTPLTKEGAEALKAELNQLKNIDRPKITEAIATAREYGDLKENAEYHAAREQQGLAEARIRDIEAKLSNCQIIDVTTITNEGKVIFGSTVTMVDENDNEVTYQIVGEDEANVKLNKISVTSPVARAMIGKQVDDPVVVQTPNGEIEYEVTDVKYI